MEISEDSKDLLQAHAELLNQAYSFMKSVALSVALDLRIADAIRNHGGAATLSQILAEIGISQCKLPGLRRLMRVLTMAGTFTIQPLEASSDRHEPVYKLTTVSRLFTSKNGGEDSPNISPMLNHVLNPFRDSVLSMGLTAWFRHDEPLGPCPFALMHGETMWEMSGRDDAVNASVNDAMAADTHFLMQIVLKECREIFHGIDSLVDVAGGVGGAASAIASAFPSLKCSVLDLPHVVAKAPSVSNVQFVAGDMFESIPPANAVFLKWILHDWGDDECIRILKNCKQAIPSKDAGGKVIIIDMVVGSKSSDVKLLETQVICDLDFMKIGGAERDEQEWKKIFLEAGFKDYTIMPVLGLRSIIVLYP
ncbi:5-pentadecatrienyl resorcinol O-methyltransferase [Dichanthelium oligosanthes]|uniref:5-pentadecatrienyl resorcinol O-methyltransferase n=1 Tax=Dichanthelium oligosanthes TaxID=888268 RepID=A0A1E5VTK5_9POAL|nr:5-pentadecatrienyl resorcinol O-methyltransferase [Dichanthelium oligosanthes]